MNKLCGRLRISNMFMKLSHLIVVICVFAQSVKVGASEDLLGLCLKEIASSFQTFNYLNPSDSKVFYTAMAERGCYELRFVDLKTLEDVLVPLDYPIEAIDAWSPNGRNLLIQCFEKQYRTYAGGRSERPTWLFVLDTADLSVTRLGSSRDVLERDPVWCSDQTLIFSVQDFRKEHALPVRYWVNWKQGREVPTTQSAAWKALLSLHDADVRLMRLGKNKLAFTDKGVVFSWFIR